MRHRAVSTFLLFAALIVSDVIVTAGPDNPAAARKQPQPLALSSGWFSANNHEAVTRIDVVPGLDNTGFIVFAGDSNNHGCSFYVP